MHIRNHKCYQGMLKKLLFMLVLTNFTKHKLQFWQYSEVNLCQKLSFLNQLTHNMTRDCSLNTSLEQVVYKYFFECQNKNKKAIVA